MSWRCQSGIYLLANYVGYNCYAIGSGSCWLNFFFFMVTSWVSYIVPASSTPFPTRLIWFHDYFPSHSIRVFSARCIIFHSSSILHQKRWHSSDTRWYGKFLLEISLVSQPIDRGVDSATGEMSHLITLTFGEIRGER